MNFIISIVFFFIGVGVGSFTLIPVLIIIMFGVPFTKTLEKKKVLNQNNGIIKRYLISLLILSIVFLTTFFITLNYFPAGLIGLLIGVGMVIILGFGKLGENESNVTDYFKRNEGYLNNEEVEKLYSKSLGK